MSKFLYCPNSYLQLLRWLYNSSLILPGASYSHWILMKFMHCNKEFLLRSNRPRCDARLPRFYQQSGYFLETSKTSKHSFSFNSPKHKFQIQSRNPRGKVESTLTCLGIYWIFVNNRYGIMRVQIVWFNSRYLVADVQIKLPKTNASLIYYPQWTE